MPQGTKQGQFWCYLSLQFCLPPLSDTYATCSTYDVWLLLSPTLCLQHFCWCCGEQCSSIRCTEFDTFCEDPSGGNLWQRAWAVWSYHWHHHCWSSKFHLMLYKSLSAALLQYWRRLIQKPSQSCFVHWNHCCMLLDIDNTRLHNICSHRIIQAPCLNCFKVTRQVNI